jgi:hypothetical protein
MDQHQPDPVAVAPERLDHPVGAVGRQSEDGVDPPVDQPTDQQVRGELPHQAPSPSVANGLEATSFPRLYEMAGLEGSG